MILFLDIEASGLGSGSFPIEIAWVDEAGVGESHLIRPAPGWTQWSAKAETLHGITRAMLAAQGADHSTVARRAAAVLTGAARLISDAPEWDQHWLDRLAEAAGLPRIGRVAGWDAAPVVSVAPRHRALPDAQALRQRYLAAVWRLT